ncbi:hypothetical protein [Mycolicibacterium komossense]|uniref:Uncharacterized protein n=1 Tax=Mycolicibacterium komossense TaxID=1779 RepID=A0ABT3CF77_9MYCO|nr:hypothetical protein [Mycolicibacterium komossense]MCV7228056.1 hypothetical protein [Mycolicibacterium komossense]
MPGPRAVQQRAILAYGGPIAAADAFSAWNVPVLIPDRYRVAATVKLLEKRLCSTVSNL